LTEQYLKQNRSAQNWLKFTLSLRNADVRLTIKVVDLLWRTQRGLYINLIK